MRSIRFATALLSVAVAAAPAFAQTPASRGSPIDRHALVTRHDVTVRAADPFGVLSVGNGEFAFNVDVTGLQSFPAPYEKSMPLGTLSTWGWHNFPNPDGYALDKFTMAVIPRNGRDFVYPASSTSTPAPDAAYLRMNAHRIGLGRVGLEMTHADGSPVQITDLKNIEQKLDLWGGVITSVFEVDGTPVRVTTAAHPDRDEVGATVTSPLVAAGRLKVRIAFPYASTSFGPEYQDWTKPDAHTTTLTRRGDTGADFARTLDATRYTVRARWNAGGTVAQTGPHQYLLSNGGDRLEFSAWFAPAAPPADADTPAAVEAASRDHWKTYWSTGGAIDLSGTADPRAAELERRLVLSQYVMVVHDAGSYPPQETGLAANSWYGKFHMEMYWWHSAHWALWGHPELLERSLKHLPELMPAGAAMAKREGCRGVKWSKMTDPSGSESPSGVGPALVWQQPHPVFLAELVYRAKKDKATLEAYKDIVFATADYMATFVDFDKEKNQYVLGPGVGSADEKHTDYAHNLNPTMEVGYWKWALETAQAWRTRLGLPPDELYAKVIARFPKPVVRNGVYPAVEAPAENASSGMTTWLYGVLPGHDIDKEAMRTTMHNASRGATTGPQAAITWGTSMWAMSAARLGEADRAITLLSGPYENNPFRPNGTAVRRPEQTPVYMPVNGGWLAAAAMMAAGWDGSQGPAPGFPKEWTVRYEGLRPLP
jgi:hypothetical protein